MRRLDWLLYGTDYVLRKKCKSIYKIPYSHRTVYSLEEANRELGKRIRSGRSFFAGRIGLFELAAMRAYEFGNHDKYEVVMQQIYDCAGFFPNNLMLGERFLQEMKEAVKDVDILACSGQLAENYFMNRYMSEQAAGAANFDMMEPWRYEQPWSAALKGKRVLVISPFDESVREQYAIREKLFKGTEVLPEFELFTYKALQTTGDIQDERFSDWFEALEFMYEEIQKIEYDIALLGCGAYGFPLASRLKKDGRQAIHMGGVLQILFGIMGKRWDGTGPNSTTHRMREDIAKYYNENWTYPKESETPKSASKVEYGPYWK